MHASHVTEECSMQHDLRQMLHCVGTSFINMLRELMIPRVVAALSIQGVQTCDNIQAYTAALTYDDIDELQILHRCKRKREQLQQTAAMTARYVSSSRNRLHYTTRFENYL